MVALPEPAKTLVDSLSTNRYSLTAATSHGKSRGCSHSLRTITDYPMPSPLPSLPLSCLPPKSGPWDAYLLVRTPLALPRMRGLVGTQAPKCYHSFVSTTLWVASSSFRRPVCMWVSCTVCELLEGERAGITVSAIMDGTGNYPSYPAWNFRLVLHLEHLKKKCLSRQA